MLVTPLNVSSSDVVLDISPDATRYIDGAVNINYENFLGKGGQFKSVSEISRMLADAGISRNDSVVVTGKCLPCGGGPSPAVFTYWLLKYLGHEKVRVLDGSIEDWLAAGLNISDKPDARPKTNYTPSLKPEILATYDFVVNGGAQVVDARPARDFDIGSIPSAINIPYEDVLENERIKQEEELQKVFIDLRKDLPVVVYTNVGVEASLVWFALTLSGYDARLYSWRDWLENQPKFNFELVDIAAKPNLSDLGGYDHHGVLPGEADQCYEKLIGWRDQAHG
jgi:thiosulfate/3-mercaptopyruvate sulfurtransferase